MADFANANLCGASPELNSVLSKLDDAKAEILAKIDDPASTASAAFSATQNELSGLINKLQTIEIPTLPKLNLQAEIANLVSLVSSSPSFLSALAKIKLEFDDDIKAEGLDLETLVAIATKAIARGGDLCAIVPNFEKESGSTEPSVEEPAAVKQAAVNALTEFASVINQNKNIISKIELATEELKMFAVSNVPLTVDRGAFKVADEDIAKILSSKGGELIKVVLPGSGKNFSIGAGFSHRSYAGVLDNYDPDLETEDINTNINGYD